jgi:O-6-methylguanine DNA methyltransferase
MAKNQKKIQSFRERVLLIVKKIPEGSALTYGEVASRAGNPRAARGVGAIMKTNFDPLIPCHRVVRKDGIGGYNRGVRQKKRKLTAEGFLP